MKYSSNAIKNVLEKNNIQCSFCFFSFLITTYILLLNYFQKRNSFEMDFIIYLNIKFKFLKIFSEA
jgi:aerobic-type carbon monoxide dehydrogenase small subunit (CoxS/CutS family)